MGVREVVERRLARLRPACATLVTTAAVAGPEFGAALLARVTGEPAAAVRDLLDEAAGAHILDGPQGPLRPYRFVHDLFRESILAGLDPPALARLHLRVACALEEERDAGEPVAAAQLADHFAKGGPGAGDGGRPLRRPGRRRGHPAPGPRRGRPPPGAGSRGPRRAGPWRPPDRAAARARRRPPPGRRPGRQLAGLPPGGRAGPAARPTRARLARAALGLHAVGTRSWPSPVQELVPVLEEAAAALGDQDPPLRARVLASLARELAWNGTDLARASRLADEAMATARGTGDRATLGACLVARHNAGWGPQNAADRLALAGRVAELAGREDPELLAEARLLAATDRLELADPRFQRELAEFLRVAADLGQPRLRYAALARRAAQGLLAGRLDEAERLTVEAADLGRAIGEPDVADVEQAQLWELRSLQGRRSELLPQVRAVFGGRLAAGVLPPGHDPAGAGRPRRRRGGGRPAAGQRGPGGVPGRPELDPGGHLRERAGRRPGRCARPASGCTTRSARWPAARRSSGRRSPSGVPSTTTWACWPRPWAGRRRPGATSSGPWPSTSRLGARTWALRSRYELALRPPGPG